MSRIIEVVVSPKGETTVQTKGYVAGDCLQASKFLEQALGITTGDPEIRTGTLRYRPALASSILLRIRPWSDSRSWDLI